MRANDAAVTQSSEFPDWMTPWPLVAAVLEEFNRSGRMIDLAADEKSAITNRWLGPKSKFADDALTFAWSDLVGWAHASDTGWLNAPWSREMKMPIDPWIRKAVEEAALGFTTVTIVPHRPDTRWWRLAHHAQEIREIPHRVKFVLPPAAFEARNRRREAEGKTPLKGKSKTDGGGRDIVELSGAGFPSVILVFRPQPGIVGPALPRRVVWDYLKRTKGA